MPLPGETKWLMLIIPSMPTPKSLLYRVQRIRHFYLNSLFSVLWGCWYYWTSGRRQGGKIGWGTYNSECGHISLWEGNYLKWGLGKAKKNPLSPYEILPQCCHAILKTSIQEITLIGYMQIFWDLVVSCQGKTYNNRARMQSEPLLSETLKEQSRSWQGNFNPWHSRK